MKTIGIFAQFVVVTFLLMGGQVQASPAPDKSAADETQTTQAKSNAGPGTVHPEAGKEITPGDQIPAAPGKDQPGSTGQAQAAAQTTVTCALNYNKDPRPKDSKTGLSKGTLEWKQISDSKMCEDATVGLGDDVYLWVEPLQAGQAVSADGTKTNPEDLRLHLNELEVQDSKAYWVEGDNSHAIIRILLERTPDSKAVWNHLLAAQKTHHAVRATVGATGKKPLASIAHFDLEVMHFGVLFWIFAVSFVILAIILATNDRVKEMLRDDGPAIGQGRAAYSLARVQMAWWFAIVVLSYVFIWLITGDRDTVNNDVLALIGISAGTFLGAVSIDASKKSQAQAQIPVATAKLAETQASAAQMGVANAALAAAASQAVNAQRDSLARLNTQVLSDRHESFLADILNDENGVSFHRFQIVVWSVVLAIIFTYSVWQTLSMPTFGNTLLGLLGISGGTYLGFKFPEQKTN